MHGVVTTPAVTGKRRGTGRRGAGLEDHREGVRREDDKAPTFFSSFPPCLLMMSLLLVEPNWKQIIKEPERCSAKGSLLYSR